MPVKLELPGDLQFINLPQGNQMTATKVKALILDYGGVISKPQNSANVNNILHILKQEHHDFNEIYQSKRASYDSGHISGEEYWKSILQHYGLESENSDISKLIQEDVKSWTHLNDSMIQFVNEIRSKVYKLAIISNMTTDSLAYIRTHFNWLELFDELIFSCDIGINKPDKRIYEACLTKLNLPPHECLFVDDSADNIRGAVEVGINTIHFNSISEFLQELDKNFSLSR